MTDKDRTIKEDMDGAHFIGVGGVGMSAIALALVSRGCSISGSDLKESATTRRLREMGVHVMIGHRAENVASARKIVISTAIMDNNPEMKAALEKGLPIMHRSRALGALMKRARSVGVTGTHGKTTTTLMVGEVLTAAGQDPTVLVGGWVDSYEGGARLGRAELVVAEVDESDRSLLSIRPDVSVITNVDFDHPDHYSNFEHVCDTFCEYIEHLPAQSVLIYDGDDPGAQSVLKRTSREAIRYSLDDRSADLYFDVDDSQPGNLRFRVWHKGEDLGEGQLPVGGLHNGRNSAAAFAAGLSMGADVASCFKGLAGFSGVRRRFDLRGEVCGATIFDDYAHHPREIQATLSVARKVADSGKGRVFAIFQPHRYTRARALAREFGLAFDLADMVMILDIYGAGDEPIEGVDGSLIVRFAREGGHKNAVYCPAFQDVVDELKAKLRPGDVVMTMGAGDVTTLGPLLIERLGR